MITFQQPAPNPPPPCAEKSIVERMAQRVLELGMNGTAVTKDSLYEHSDYSRSQIEQHAAAACDLARSLAVRQRRA